MGSKSTQTQSIPAYVEQGGQQAIDLARQISQLGYVPFIGNDVAAYNPMQQAAAQNAIGAAQAFGLSAPSSADIGMTATTQGGVPGYSSFGGYEQAVNALAARYPGLAEALAGFTIDPVTGIRRGAQAAGQTSAQMMPAQAMTATYTPASERDYMPTQSFTGTGTGSLGLPDPMSGRITGFGGGGGLLSKIFG